METIINHFKTYDINDADKRCSELDLDALAGIFDGADVLVVVVEEILVELASVLVAFDDYED